MSLSDIRYLELYFIFIEHSYLIVTLFRRQVPKFMIIPFFFNDDDDDDRFLQK